MTEPSPRSGRWTPTVVAIEGRFVAATNATMLAETDDGVRVVYKPIAGQRPLGDFDSDTLPIREVLTYEMSSRLGFDLVPETVMADGPFGTGSVQRYVDADPDFEPLPLVQRGDPSLWRVAALDVVTNNADRKLGHLLSVDGRLVAIDHGLTFHEEDKLRTVLWSFAGRAWPEDIVAAVAALAALLDEDAEPFGSVLSLREMVALRNRIADVSDGVHPLPPADRPAVPWPPY